MSKKEGHSSGKIFYISQTPEVMGHNCSQNLHMSQEAKAVGHNPTKKPVYVLPPLDSCKNVRYKTEEGVHPSK